MENQKAVNFFLPPARLLCFQTSCHNNGTVHAQPYVNSFLELMYYSPWVAWMPAFGICSKKNLRKEGGHFLQGTHTP